MSTRCSIFGDVSLAIALGVLVVGLVPVGAQTSNPQSRPRSLTTGTQNSAGTTEDAQPQVGSPEANAEAKKLYKTGVQYGNAGLYAQAAELFQRVLILRPDHPDACRSLGHAYVDMGQWEKAIQSLEQAVLRNPKDKDARKLLEQARLKLTAATDAGSKPQQAPGSPESSQVALNVTPSIPTVSATKPSADELALTRVYRVGPGDVLDVRLSDTPSSAGSGDFTISNAGLLAHPGFADPLHVAGLTVDEIGTRLQSVLRQRPLTANARVSVGVRDYVSHTILVSGLVKDPGTKILRREAIPLSVVIADAQPLPEAARVSVLRNKSNEVLTIDLLENAETGLLVHPGDVITLQAAPTLFFYVAGEVKDPGEKTFRRGLTLTQAIISAGGLTGKGKEARVARDDGKGFLIMTRYKIKEIDSGKLADPLIQPGDRITITN